MFVLGSYVSKRDRREAYASRSAHIEWPASLLSPRKRQERECRGQIPRHCVSTVRPHSLPVTALRWSLPDGHLIASASLDGHVALMKSSGCRIEARITSHNQLGDINGSTSCRSQVSPVKDIQFSLCGQFLYSGGLDGEVHFTDLSTGICVQRFAMGGRAVTALAVHPRNDQLFLAGTANGGVAVWDRRVLSDEERTGPVGWCHHHFGTVQSLCFLDADTFVCCADPGGDFMSEGITAWDIGTRALMSNQIYTEPYTCVAVHRHPASPHFVAQSQGSYLAIFNRFEGGHAVGPFRIDFGFSPSGATLVTGSSDGRLTYYRWASGRIAHTAPPPTPSSEAPRRGGVEADVGVIAGHAVTGAAFHPLDESLAASATWSGSVSLWSARDSGRSQSECADEGYSGGSDEEAEDSDREGDPFAMGPRREREAPMWSEERVCTDAPAACLGGYACNQDEGMEDTADTEASEAEVAAGGSPAVTAKTSGTANADAKEGDTVGSGNSGRATATRRPTRRAGKRAQKKRRRMAGSTGAAADAAAAPQPSALSLPSPREA